MAISADILCVISGGLVSNRGGIIRLHAGWNRLHTVVEYSFTFCKAAEAAEAAVDLISRIGLYAVANIGLGI